LSPAERDVMRARAEQCFATRFHVEQSARSLIAALSGE